MRHCGAQVGNVCLVEKEGAPEFTEEDEEVLVLCASLAATAIANARTHRDEQRARAAALATRDVGAGVTQRHQRIAKGATYSSFQSYGRR